MLGTTIGNYEVVAKIGEGGMGVVYRARHKLLGRPVAVKVLLPEFSRNRDIVTRFFNEARAATAIRHSGIIEVFDVGFLHDQSAYLIMEFLEGETLGRRLERGRMPIAQSLAIVRAIARALQAAHEASIVHRDLKPDNVFLVTDSEMPLGERVKLLDFGIAKLATRENDGNPTRTGAVMGTPGYMAPEQCRGAGTVDYRADLYALGCIAFEMFCGRPPFVAEGVGDVIAHHLYFAPPAPSSLCPGLPAPVDELILSLLEKNPASRPRSATAIVEAIDRINPTAASAATTFVPTGYGHPNTGPELRANAIAAAPTTLGGAVSMIGASSRPRHARIAFAFATAFILTAVLSWGFLRSNETDSSAGLSAASRFAAVDVAGQSVEPLVEPSIVAIVDVDASMPTDAGIPDSAPTNPDAGIAKEVKSRTTEPRPSSRAARGSQDTHCAEGTLTALARSAESEAAIQAALTRLRVCKGSVSAAAFETIQKQLISKL